MLIAEEIANDRYIKSDYLYSDTFIGINVNFDYVFLILHLIKILLVYLLRHEFLNFDRSYKLQSNGFLNAK